MSSATLSATAVELLDAAQRLIQTRGYNAVSYRDLADVVGIKTASIHYHFPKKEDLGLALVKRYRDAFTVARRDIETRHANPADRLRAFVGHLYDSFKNRQQMCLCAVLAAEASSLPGPLMQAVREFFLENERWLESILIAGRRDKSMRVSHSPELDAGAIMAAVEGAITAAWTFNDADRLKHAGAWIIGSIIEK